MAVAMAMAPAPARRLIHSLDPFFYALPVVSGIGYSHRVQL